MRLLGHTFLGVVVPRAEFVYGPLVDLSLADLVGEYDFNEAAQVNLICDYLNGLSFLHEQKLIMHRNLCATNLCVVSLQNPRGLIIGLNEAIEATESWDHPHGAMVFLAPEVAALKDWSAQSKATDIRAQRPPAYTAAADVWSLGLNMFSINHDWPIHKQFWKSTPSSGSDRVNSAALTNLHQALRRGKKSTPLRKSIADLTIKMTAFEPAQRPSASEALNIIRLPGNPAQGDARIHLKCQVLTKRKREAVESETE